MVVPAYLMFLRLENSEIPLVSFLAAALCWILSGVINCAAEIQVIHTLLPQETFRSLFKHQLAGKNNSLSVPAVSASGGPFL